MNIRDVCRQLARNGKWGTCVDCPRDDEKFARPEECKYWGRYDHTLTPDSAAEQIFKNVVEG